MINGILVILVFGMLGNMLFQRLRLPGIPGMIIVGILIGPYQFDLLDASILDNAPDIRMIALVVILLRAGLGISRENLNSVGKAAFGMGFIPCIVEGLTVMVVAHKIVGMPLVDSGILAFVMAAVSPAVLVPSMLYLKEKTLGMNKKIPVILLAGASLDDVVAITMFSAFLGLALHTGQSLFLQIGLIPLQIVAGVLMGLFFGYIVSFIFKSSNVRLSQMERLALGIIAAFSILLLGDEFNIAGLLGIMTLGFILLEKVGKLADIMAKALNKVWFFAHIFLFVLIGSALDIQYALQAGAIGLLIIGTGLLARSLGVLIALLGSGLNRKEKLFCVIAYLPKATVQAAVGGIPLTMGMESGNFILSVAVMSIILTAPLGAIAINLSAPKLLDESRDSESL